MPQTRPRQTNPRELHPTRADTGGDGFVGVVNPYTGDPRFAPDGYHLTANSAAIDKGVSGSGVTRDIDGDPRPFGAASDLGADEYTFPLNRKLYLPLLRR